jgi:hypothetical protein
MLNESMTKLANATIHDPVLNGNLSKPISSPAKIIRIFTSSTFTGTSCCNLCSFDIGFFGAFWTVPGLTAGATVVDCGGFKADCGCGPGTGGASGIPDCVVALDNSINLPFQHKQI